MATLTQAPVLKAPGETLTYEAYLAEPQTEGRYDIINGVRVFMAGGTLRHQRVAGNIGRLLYAFEQESGSGISVSAPFDVLIRRFPKLQTRQPDVLFVSHWRIAQGGGLPVIGPLEAAPELVVEVISDTETERILSDKLADYCEIGVDECWVVRPEAGTVEVLALAADGARSVAVYGSGESVVSVALPGLTAAVAEVLAA